MTHSKPSAVNPSVLGGRELELSRLEPPSTDGFLFPGWLVEASLRAKSPVGVRTARSLIGGHGEIGKLHAERTSRDGVTCSRPSSNMRYQVRGLVLGSSPSVLLPINTFPATTPGEKPGDVAGVSFAQYMPSACLRTSGREPVAAPMPEKSRRENLSTATLERITSPRSHLTRSTRQAPPPRSTATSRPAASVRATSAVTPYRPN